MTINTKYALEAMEDWFGSPEKEEGGEAMFPSSVIERGDLSRLGKSTIRVYVYACLMCVLCANGSDI